eukprot:gene6508-10516_t
MPRIVDGKIVEDLESQTPADGNTQASGGDFGMSQMQRGMNNFRIGLMIGMAVLIGLFFGIKAMLVSLAISGVIYIAMTPDARTRISNLFSGMFGGGSSSSTQETRGTTNSGQGRTLGSNIRTMADLPPEPKRS